MKKKMPSEIEIGGRKCVNRETAAEILKMSLSTLDKIVARTKAKKARVAIEFIQYTKGSPIWFPRDGIEKFLDSLAVEGGSAI